MQEEKGLVELGVEGKTEAFLIRLDARDREVPLRIVLD